jgi:3-phosphoglycerate kinase
MLKYVVDLLLIGLHLNFYTQSSIATEAEGIPDGWLGLDVGPKTREIFRSTVLEARTILWNGCLRFQFT